MVCTHTVPRRIRPYSHQVIGKGSDTLVLCMRCTPFGGASATPSFSIQGAWLTGASHCKFTECRHRLPVKNQGIGRAANLLMYIFGFVFVFAKAYFYISISIAYRQ